MSGWKAICVMSATACWPITSIKSGGNYSIEEASSRQRRKKASAPKKRRRQPEAVCLDGVEFFGKPGKKERQSVSLTNDFILIDIPYCFSTKTGVFCQTLFTRSPGAAFRSHSSPA